MSTSTQTPTFTQFAHDNVDEFLQTAQKAMATGVVWHSGNQMDTPWGTLNLDDLNGLNATVFVDGCRLHGDRACDRGALVTPTDAREDNIRVLRLMCRRARDLNARRFAAGLKPYGVR